MIDPQNVAAVLLETYQGGSAAFAPADLYALLAAMVRPASARY